MGKVPSFLYLFQQHGESKDTFPDHVKDALTDYLEEQFDKVLVGVNTSDIDGKESTYTLSISALVTVDGVPYNLAREVVINGSEFEIVNNKRTK